jgi:hypothetical protein
MHIFLDESGTFSASNVAGSFCVVAGYIVPERCYSKIRDIVRRFKLKAGFASSVEVKRRDVDERQYFSFLQELGEIDAIAVALATDSSYNGDPHLHKAEQAEKISDQVSRMRTAEGAQLVSELANDVRRLSDQNYIELVLRSLLVWQIIQISTLYYVTRTPATLGSFRWKFDQKDLRRNHFETTFERLSGTLVQTMSIDDPLICVEGADYSHFHRFASEGPVPDWMPTSTARTEAQAVNGGVIWRQDLNFVDSKHHIGVQVADLIVSGIRGCLRRDFADNEQAAQLIGKLLVKPARGDDVIRFRSFSAPEGAQVDSSVTRLVRIMQYHARQMIPKSAHATLDF